LLVVLLPDAGPWAAVHVGHLVLDDGVGIAFLETGDLLEVAYDPDRSTSALGS
jgi:hypothetical protein